MIIAAENLVVKEYTAVRDIMLLAQSKGYPTWYIYPHYLGLALVLNYAEGKLAKVLFEDKGRLEPLDMREVIGIPDQANSLTSTVRGVLVSSISNPDTAQIEVFERYVSGDSNLKFIACDIDQPKSFPDKMKFLQSLGFLTPDYVLFPTSRLPTIPSSHLENSFHNYIAQSRNQGTFLNGVTITGDEASIMYLPDSS